MLYEGIVYKGIGKAINNAPFSTAPGRVSSSVFYKRVRAAEGRLKFVFKIDLTFRFQSS